MGERKGMVSPVPFRNLQPCFEAHFKTWSGNLDTTTHLTLPNSHTSVPVLRVEKGTLTQCTQCWMLRKCQLNSRDCGAVDKNLGNELNIYSLALSKTTPDVLSSFSPHMSLSSNVVLNPWSYIPDVSNFYSPLISHLEPEPPPLIRTKWRRRGRETQERRKGGSLRKRH